jgi:hypothetical protein
MVLAEAVAGATQGRPAEAARTIAARTLRRLGLTFLRTVSRLLAWIFSVFMAILLSNA